MDMDKARYFIIKYLVVQGLLCDLLFLAYMWLVLQYSIFYIKGTASAGTHAH